MYRIFCSLFFLPLAASAAQQFIPIHSISPLILPMVSGWFCWMHRSSFRTAFWLVAC